jgi:3-dehydroshikimate dehydratase
MIIPGLVSITFRQLSPSEIIELVAEVNLQVIEWGGDVHVPHGDTKQAEAVARWTVDAGLSVSAYGSYYRLATPDQPTFESVAETAVTLGAPTIRVWAGKRGSADADENYRKQVYDEAHYIAEIAKHHKLTVSFEFHDGTLTDTTQSALDLMNVVNHDSLKLYWQPPHRISDEDREKSLRSVLPYLTHVHVFQWHRNHPEMRVRYPLQEGQSAWSTYLDHLKRSERDHSAMLEFVRDDDPDQFREDAKTLLSCIE